MCVAGAPALSAEPSDLPGPGLDVPVDADGDGGSSYGDRYAFNYWLALGGNLEKALEAAEAGKNGLIDLSKFFGSADALLAPQSTEAEILQESATGGGTPLTTGCATSASIVAPYGAPTPPASLLMSCEVLLGYPTAAEMDPKQGEMDSKQSLWISRLDPTDPYHDNSGVALLNLPQAPPMGNDGTIPLESLAPPTLTNQANFQAEDIVVRTDPQIPCNAGGASSIHALSTWANDDLLCPSMRSDSDGGLCGLCSIITPEQPFAIDAVRAGMPPDHFGVPQDAVFSAVVDGTLRIRSVHTPTPEPPTPNQCYWYGTVAIWTDLATLSNVSKVWSLALGDFKGAGVFAAYYTASPLLGYRQLRRLRKVGGQLH